VNERLYDQLGRLLKDDLRFNANGEYYWTNNGGSKIKVGAHYDSYTFQGNTVVFMVDKILSDEYPYQDTVSQRVLIKQLQTLVSQCLH
jgi:hypothetical protein